MIQIEQASSHDSEKRYFSRSKISQAKFREILRYFAINLTATDCSELSGFSVRSIKTICLRIRLANRWRGNDGLVDVGFDKHLRVNHGKNEFARGNAHVNGIENFWSYAKRRLVKFNGVPKHMLYLHLKKNSIPR